MEGGTTSHQQVRVNPHTAEVWMPLRARVKMVRACMLRKLWVSENLLLLVLRHMHARNSPVTTARNKGPKAL